MASGLMLQCSTVSPGGFVMLTNSTTQRIRAALDFNWNEWLQAKFPINSKKHKLAQLTDTHIPN